MKTNSFPRLAILLSGIAVLAILMHFAREANANPSRLTRCSTSATSGETGHTTTTPRYMTAGTGTTTLDCGTDGADHFDLRIRFKASSTLSNLRFHVAHSDDNVDWYPVAGTITTNASTSMLTGTYQEYAIPYASSTSQDNGGNTDTMAVTIKFRDIAARYTRVRMYLPPGSLNGAVYAEIVQKEQRF